MSVTKKFCEVEEGLVIGRVSIDANSGNITTDGPVNINSLNVNNLFFVENNGGVTASGSVLIAQNLGVEGLIEVVGNATIGGTLNVAENVHFEKDLTIDGDQLITTSTSFNLLNKNVDTINFGHTASNISIGKSGDHWVTTNSNLEVVRNLTVGYQFEVAEGKFQFDGVYGNQGATRLQGILEVGQQASFEDNVSIGASLSVGFNANITGYLKVFNNFNVNDKFTVAYATGNTVIAGTTDITGNLSAASYNGDINSSSIEATSSLIKLKSTNVEISDTIVYLGTGNTGATKDIGFIGHFNNGTYQHTGLLRDATDNTWKLFSNAIAEITDTVDIAGVVYDPLKAGNITSTDTITATNNVVTPKVQLPNAQLTGKALTLGAWVIQEDPNNDGSILFSYNGTTVLSLGSNGALTVTNDITAWGTPA